MEESFRLGRIAGIPVGINWSVLLIAWLLSWSLASHRFPTSYPGHTPGAYWTAGVVAAVVFLASLLAHELGHALVARRYGVRVDGITLWLFGGVAKLGGEAATPRAELRIAAVGPAVSVGLAALFGAVALALDGFGAPALIVGSAVWLATINVILAVFNMVPAAPLDGGRVLRAYLWRRSGDRLKATVAAANAGRVFGFVLIGLGVVEFAAGAGLGGLWFVFLGWFLLNAAKAEQTHAILRGALAGVRVRDLMTRDPIVAPDHLTVGEFLEAYVMRHRWSAFPVTGHDGAITGLVTLAHLKAVPSDRRDVVHVHDIACPIAQVTVADPDDSITDVLERLGTCKEGRVLVFSAGELVGIVSPTDVMRMVEVATLSRGRASVDPGAPSGMPS